MLLTVQADQAFEPSGDPDTSSGAGPRHHVVVWLFTNRYRQFEFTSLRQRVIANRCLVVAFGAAARMLIKVRLPTQV